MPELLLSLYFAYKNALIAKTKGLNTVAWVFLTLLAFLLGEFTGMAIVIGMFYRGPLDPAAVQEYVFRHPLHLVFIYFSAAGGCLLVRYLLERKTAKNKTPEDTTTDEDKE